MSHIFFPDNDNSGFTSIGGSYNVGIARQMSGDEVAIAAGESGEPFSICCEGTSTPAPDPDPMELTLDISGQELYLLNDGVVLDSVTLPSGSGTGNSARDYGTVNAMPTTTSGQASHHFWAISHSGGELSITTANGVISPAIAGSPGVNDEYHITNLGPDNLKWTDTYGNVFYFFVGDIVSFVKVSGTQYRLI